MTINPEMTEHNFFQANDRTHKRCPACNKKHKPKLMTHSQKQSLPVGELTEHIPIYVCFKTKKPTVMLGTRAAIMQMTTELWLRELDEYPVIQ